MLEFGLSVDTGDSERMMSCINQAENTGFRYAWIPDVGFCRDIFVLGGVIALQTNSIRIGPGVTNPYTRNPAVSALAVATLNEISHGRAVYGIGVGGYATLTAFGMKTWDRPVTALKEAIEVSRRIFAGDVRDFEGKMFSVGAAGSFLKKPVSIPICVAVMTGMQSLRIAGELADGVILAGPLGPDFTRSMIEYVRDSAKSVGRDPNKIAIHMDALCSVSHEGQRAIDLVKAPIARRIIGDARFYPAVKQAGVTDDTINKVKQTIGDANTDKLSKLVSSETAENFAVAGTPEQCVEQIREYNRIGITGMILDGPYGPGGIEEAVKIAGDEILPHFR